MIDETAGFDSAPPEDSPILILGIPPRCGTNILSDLLCLHPDCGPPAPIWEDFLVAHIDVLERYIDTVTGRWDPGWGVAADARQRLASALGSGVVSFLSEQGDMHWKEVQKTAVFDPMSRFRHWMSAQHERFNWVAGSYLEQLGYEILRPVGNRVFRSLWNVLLDLKWQVVRTLGPIYLKLKGNPW